MTWILSEGVDRTGKSTIAKLYKSKGFKVVHFSAPNKKYFEPGYTGPSYLDEILEIMMELDGKDVFWDRTPHYGELIWPSVYNRKAMLTQDDLDILREYEIRNKAQRILMIDSNKEAHWKRCVENNEPLNRAQFEAASRLFSKLAHEHEFMPRSLEDFDDELARIKREDPAPLEKTSDDEFGPVTEREIEAAKVDLSPKDQAVVKAATQTETTSPVQEKLEKANAINSILSKRIVRSKGPIYDKIEEDIKSFLNNKLSDLIGNKNKVEKFSEDEVTILKVLCKQWQSKLNGDK